MKDKQDMVLAVIEEWHVARARQAAKSMARLIGLSRVAVYSVATSVTELGNNIFFHARDGGTITLRTVRQDQNVGIEILARDSGPGIADVALAMADGYTTNGGLGCGLPGVARLMDGFEITSQIGAGTQVTARKWAPCS